MKFVARTLAVLDNLFSFEGSQVSVQNFEMGGAIQPVFDVAPEMRRLRFPLLGHTYGYFINGADHTHAAADTQISSTDPYAGFLDAVVPSPRRPMVWLLGWGIQSSIALTASQLSVAFPLNGPWSTWDYVIAAMGATVGINAIGRAAQPNGAFLSATNGMGHIVQFPIPIPRGATFNGRTVSSAAGTAAVRGLFYVTADGAFPPGL